MHTVIDDLSNQQIVTHPFLFKMLVNFKNNSHQLKAGQYLFRKGTSESHILYQITTGTGLAYHTFTIVPGWNFKELRAALSHDPYLHQTIQSLSDDNIMKKLGANFKPEGLFYPDTYYFMDGADDMFILNRSYNAMQKKLNNAWKTRDPELPFKTPYEALIAASIIEKEAYVEQELPKIAGVMINRLKKDMLLQFDPTVIYGVGDKYTGSIRRSDLQANNPYNTYVHKGLPPTPIAMPSMAAITAILHPMQHDYYYFVADSTGNSTFSGELNDHNKAVETARKNRWFFNFSLTKYYLLKYIQNIT